MNCPSCGSVITDAPNFCPSCGKRLNKEVPKSDFEIGKIAALDTIKNDFRNWILGLAAIFGLLGFLGVREYVKSAVDSSVRDALNSLSSRIEKASTDAQDATAKARIETKQLDTTIDMLDGKATTLTKSIDAVNSQKNRLVASAEQLQAQQRQMVKATNDLDEKRKQLARIIESENLTTLFAKMRSDFYRIRTVEARVEFVASSEQFGADLPEYFSFAQIALARPVSSGSKERQFVAELRILNDSSPTRLFKQGNARPSSVVFNYVLFDPFQRDLEGKPMSALNGIDDLLLQFRTSAPDADQKVKNFRKFLEQLVDCRSEFVST